ncbi:MAG: hypothetical protein WCO98_11110 [bacterium]
MKCAEKAGFLLLHECGNIAETRCIYCGKHICNQHTYALSQDMILKLPQIPPANVKAIGCIECFRKNRVEQPQNSTQQSQTSGGMQQNLTGTPNSNTRSNINNPDSDPNYRYPYFGGYMPYIFYSGFNNNDRTVFNNPGYGTTENSSDMMDS